MTTAQQAWSRLSKLAAFKSMKESDFRPIVYTQQFAAVGAGALSANIGQQFPGGAIVLGITSSCYKNGIAINAQGNRNRQSYGLNFSYTNNESLTPGGPASADALLGGGDMNLFPPRELLLSPNQTLAVQVQNFSSDALTIHVCFHCLIYRYAS